MSGKAQSLKAKINNFAKSKQISAQAALQTYMFERFLERVSISKYKNNFILKGGLLISSILGISLRATMDLDATLKGINFTQVEIENVFEAICQIPLDDGISFKISSVATIRGNDIYGGFRISANAVYDRVAVPLKFDFSTGDAITPRAVKSDYKLLLEARTIKILNYNVETILAEKLETVLSRSTLNTRPRDFYDIYMLSKLKSADIDYKLLASAFKNTAEHRSSIVLKADIDIAGIIKNIYASKELKKQWDKYAGQFAYAKDISFDEVCGKVGQIANKIFV
jgi:predicted nucleotidyltransferase component of viral defense system